MSAKHQIMRDAVMSFVEDRRARGGVWDAVQLPHLSHIARLTDARFLRIEDGMVGKAVTTLIRDSNASVTPGIANPAEALVDLVDGRDPQARLILFTPFELDTAHAASNAATLLHELIHHAEYRAGLLGLPGARGNPAIQERNTDYVTGADGALTAIHRLETLRGHFETDFPTADSDDLIDYMGSFAQRMRDLHLLERGSAVRHHTNADAPKGLAIRPDLDFLRHEMNIDLSTARVSAHFLSGDGGPVMQAVFRDILPTAQTLMMADEDALIAHYKDEVRRFAAVHRLDAKDLEERLASAETQARAEYARSSQEARQLMSELLEKHLEPLRT